MTKTFAYRDLLSVTTGHLLTAPQGDRDNGIGNLYELLNWMTGDSVFTHQIPRVSDECVPWLLRWFPELAKVDSLVSELDTALSGAKLGDFSKAQVNHLVNEWLDRVRIDCGLRETYEVPRIPTDDHEKIDPFDELVVMRGTDEGISIINI